MVVLSLFDGMSCGRLALERAGINIDGYFASEVDKYAIQVAKNNWSDIVHIGDVTKVKYLGGKLYDELGNVVYQGKIDLLIGGSPCQSFSQAGDGSGFDGKSKLFWEYVRLLEEVNPTFFFLENVVMKKDWESIITKSLGVIPIEINSSLVSAQRRRLYWGNFHFDYPEDKGVLLKDILVKDGYQVLSEGGLAYMNREVSGGRNHWDFAHHSDVSKEKSSSVVANFSRGIPYNVLIDGDVKRKFTPIECERLQTLPDNYTVGVSDTQRYKMIGNGWTVDVVAHIFSYLNKQL